MFSAETRSPFPPPRIPFDRVARNARHAREHDRLRKNLLALIRAHPNTQYLGRNWAVAQLADDHGFKPEDLVIVRLEIAAAPVTVIVVPGRHWHRRHSKVALFSVKRMAAGEGTRCMLIADSVVLNHRHLESSRLISSALSANVSISARMSLVSYLIENGPSSLEDCSTILGGDNPFSGVLHLAAIGALQIDLKRPLGPHSLVHLPSNPF